MAFYHLFAHGVNEKRTGSFPAFRKNREGQRSRLMIFWYFEMDSLQQDSPMTAMSRDSGDLISASFRADKLSGANTTTCCSESRACISA
jgi:hypothetical protein